MKLPSFALACLAVTACSTTVLANRLPWLDPKAIARSANGLVGSRTHSAPQRRSSNEVCDPMNACGPGQCPTGNCGGCVVQTPGSRKRAVPGQIFVGDILDPAHAVRFLLSETGTYTHDNGSVMVDPFYMQGRRRKLEEHAQRGLISRMAASSLSAFATVLPKTMIAKYFLENDNFRGKLFVFTPQTALDSEDIPEVIDLLLEREWDSFTIAALKIERAAIEHMQAALAGRVDPNEDTAEDDEYRRYKRSHHY